MKKKVYIGTSGYSYNHWKNIFYPEELKPSQYLLHYSNYFDSLELNVTFYRLLQEKTFENWFQKTPKDFKFVVKGWRIITHIKRLKNCKNEIKSFFKNISALKEKLICILCQLPSNFACDVNVLKEFLDLCCEQGKWYHSFEFRNKTWMNDDVYITMKQKNANICFADSPAYPVFSDISSSFVYFRFHGSQSLYGSKYSLEQLKNYAEKIKEFIKNCDFAFAFFNNDFNGYAVENALELKKLLKDYQ
jgi:uncharacterized protein YecE (DUF72 family)